MLRWQNSYLVILVRVTGFENRGPGSHVILIDSAPAFHRGVLQWAPPQISSSSYMYLHFTSGLPHKFLWKGCLLYNLWYTQTLGVNNVFQRSLENPCCIQLSLTVLPHSPRLSLRAFCLLAISEMILIGFLEIRSWESWDSGSFCKLSVGGGSEDSPSSKSLTLPLTFNAFSIMSCLDLCHLSKGERTSDRTELVSTAH